MSWLICFRYLIVTKCEAVSPALEAEYKAEVKSEETGIVLKPKQEESGIVLKPKQEIQTKSVAQIVHEQSGKWVLFLVPFYFSSLLANGILWYGCTELS